VVKPQEHPKNPIQDNQLAVGVHRPGNLVSEAKLGYRPPARQRDKSQLPRPFFLLWRRLDNRRTATSPPLSDLFGNSVSKSVKCVQEPLVEFESRSPNWSQGHPA
jgi:hypothetical protein